jgi:acyl-homoserine-lactone acylase
MDAWADGLNYYLHTHPEVTPRVITRFEPWMALTFSEGSIGGDIERVNLRELEAFYGGRRRRVGRTAGGAPAPRSGRSWPLASPGRPALEPTGLERLAIASAREHRDGNALLLINPHTSFFFRHEAQMVSEEGLNAYGALTWGQFFIYQGFNETGRLDAHVEQPPTTSTSSSRRS